MSINGLIIDERLVNQFRANCLAHYQTGKHFPAHHARQLFFAALKQEYDLSHVVSNLADLMSQLAAWEVETHEQLKAA